jgi:hypothetical protein
MQQNGHSVLNGYCVDIDTCLFDFRMLEFLIVVYDVEQVDVCGGPGLSSDDH